MMTYNKALEIAERLKTVISNQFSVSDKEDIITLYREVLRKEFVKSSCNDCYRDALIEVYTYLKREGKMKEKSEYSLKNGVVIQVFGTNKVYTNANITNEAAEAYLKEYPKGINLFAYYPDDWETRIAGKAIEEVTLNEELVTELAGKLAEGATKKSLKEDYKAYEIDGKALTARALDSYLKAADELNQGKE
ncbi:hypothetical protein [uncultured Bacteroides sp.]|uniref:hypothetical protein n=1 Tax=uncultured Bacteroides sp. TaxID=162156 RepID=UPI002AABA6A2|nr:hypothetical protein [uncultured Bacteroides sp.]